MKQGMNHDDMGSDMKMSDKSMAMSTYRMFGLNIAISLGSGPVKLLAWGIVG
jgi:hypothetical protein